MTSRYRVIVLRVWRDPQGVLVRLLIAGEPVPRRAFVVEARQLWPVLEELLVEFENETSEDTDD